MERKQSVGKVMARKTMVLVLGLSVWLTAMPMLPVMAVVVPPSPPRNLVVSEIGYRDEGITRSWFARFGWELLPWPAGAAEPWQTFTFDQVQKNSGTMTTARTVLLPSTVASMDTALDISPELQSGTIYALSGTTSYRHGDMNQFISTSARSASIKFLTGVQVGANRVPGTNDIRVVWDDVWDTTGRINYQLLISETQGFSQPPAIPIIQGKDVGTPESLVTVNAGAGKLEYVWTGASPGREYIVKVVPIPASDVQISRAADIPTTPPIQTGILLFAQKVGFTDDDVIWRFYWDPIASDQFSRVEYSLFRRIDNAVASETNVATIPNTNEYFLTIPKTDARLYSFKVEAIATPKEDPNDRVFFLSDAYVELRETIPEKPEAPVFSDFPNANPPQMFDELLLPTQATLLFQVPLNGAGQVDADVTYDVFLTQSVDAVLDPQADTRIASRVTMGPANEIRHATTNQLMGYRYVLTGLQPNAMYYASMKANKQYLLPDASGRYQTTMLQSEASTKVIVTEPDEGVTRPVAPPSPPFGVARDEEGLQRIGLDTVELRMDKKWHQFYTPATAEEILEGKIGRWDWVEKATYDANELLADNDPAKKIGQIVNYPVGTTLVPYAVPYATVLERVEFLFPGRGDYVAYSDLSQPFMTQLLSIRPAQPVATVPNIDPNESDQSFTFGLTGLQENTAYLVWIRVRNAQGLLSDPSDPLVVTTRPEEEELVTIPVVPNFIALLAGDDFIDVTWDSVVGMDYDISWGTTENRAAAQGTVRVREAAYSLRGFYRLEELQPETNYYLWIRAINTELNASGAAVGIASGWSGAHLVRTEPWQPPASPSGFGVREGIDGITATTITYEWVDLSDLTYQIEFADNADFMEAKVFPASGGTHTVSGLISNRRYYARLFAVSPGSGIRSTSTATVAVVTRRSRLDYDSSYDLDDVPEGDHLTYEAVTALGVWGVSSKGLYAHRLAETMRDLGEPVVQIDLRTPPSGTKTIRVELGSVVYDTLASLKMDLIIRTPGSDWTVRPGAFQTDPYFRTRIADPEMTVRVEVRSPATSYEVTPGVRFASPVTDLRVNAMAGSRATALTAFARPLRATMAVSSLSSYRRDEIALHTWSSPGVWTRRESQLDYETGSVGSDLLGTAPVVAAVRDVKAAETMPSWVRTAVEEIVRQYDLHTLSSGNWKAGDPVSQEMLAKLLLDVVPFDWRGTEPLTVAIRAGLVRMDEAAAGRSVRRDQAIAGAVALYERKTGERAVPEFPLSWRGYPDWSSVSNAHLSAVRFAVENGIVTGDSAGRLNPDANITVGEMLVLLQRVMILSGDL